MDRNFSNGHNANIKVYNRNRASALNNPSLFFPPPSAAVASRNVISSRSNINYISSSLRAPKPINLPSLLQENAGRGDPRVNIVPRGGSGWRQPTVNDPAVDPISSQNSNVEQVYPSHGPIYDNNNRFQHHWNNQDSFQPFSRHARVSEKDFPSLNTVRGPANAQATQNYQHYKEVHFDKKPNEQAFSKDQYHSESMSRSWRDYSAPVFSKNIRGNQEWESSRDPNMNPRDWYSRRDNRVIAPYGGISESTRSFSRISSAKPLPALNPDKLQEIAANPEHAWAGDEVEEMDFEHEPVFGESFGAQCAIEADQISSVLSSYHMQIRDEDKGKDSSTQMEYAPQPKLAWKILEKPQVFNLSDDMKEVKKPSSTEFDTHIKLLNKRPSMIGSMGTVNNELRESLVTDTDSSEFLHTEISSSTDIDSTTVYDNNTPLSLIEQQKEIMAASIERARRRKEAEQRKLEEIKERKIEDLKEQNIHKRFQLLTKTPATKIDDLSDSIEIDANSGSNSIVRNKETGFAPKSILVRPIAESKKFEENTDIYTPTVHSVKLDEITSTEAVNSNKLTPLQTHMNTADTSGKRRRFSTSSDSTRILPNQKDENRVFNFSSNESSKNDMKRQIYTRVQSPERVSVLPIQKAPNIVWKTENSSMYEHNEPLSTIKSSRISNVLDSDLLKSKKILTTLETRNNGVSALSFLKNGKPLSEKYNQDEKTGNDRIHQSNFRSDYQNQSLYSSSENSDKHYSTDSRSIKKDTKKSESLHSSSVEKSSKFGSIINLEHSATMVKVTLPVQSMQKSHSAIKQHALVDVPLKNRGLSAVPVVHLSLKDLQQTAHHKISTDFPISESFPVSETLTEHMPSISEKIEEKEILHNESLESVINNSSFENQQDELDHETQIWYRQHEYIFDEDSGNDQVPMKSENNRGLNTQSIHDTQSQLTPRSAELTPIFPNSSHAMSYENYPGSPQSAASVMSTTPRAVNVSNTFPIMSGPPPFILLSPYHNSNMFNWMGPVSYAVNPDFVHANRMRQSYINDFNFQHSINPNPYNFMMPINDSYRSFKQIAPEPVRTSISQHTRWKLDSCEFVPKNYVNCAKTSQILNPNEDVAISRRDANIIARDLSYLEVNPHSENSTFVAPIKRPYIEVYPKTPEELLTNSSVKLSANGSSYSKIPRLSLTLEQLTLTFKRLLSYRHMNSTSRSSNFDNTTSRIVSTNSERSNSIYSNFSSKEAGWKVNPSLNRNSLLETNPLYSNTDKLPLSGHTSWVSRSHENQRFHGSRGHLPPVVQY